MIILYPEKQTNASVDSEASNYPAINLFNYKPSKVWRAASGVDEATITLTVSSGSKYLGVFNTNAESVSVVVKNGAGVTQSTDVIDLTESGRTTFNRFWLEYTQLNETHSIETTLSAATGETVEAGIIRAGDGIVLKNPQQGLDEDPVDYSVVHELSSGAVYIRKRTVVRNFTGSVVALRTTKFYHVTDFYKAIGPQPVAVLVAERIDDRQWCCFGRFQSTPGGSHKYLKHSVISVDFLEMP